MDKYMAQKPAFVTTGHAACPSPSPTARSSRPSIQPRRRRGSSGRQADRAGVSQADDTPVFLVVGAIFNDAPHPNAEALFTWYPAKEQQSRSGTFSPRSDVPPPPGLQPLSSYKIDSGFRRLVSDESRAAELRKRFGVISTSADEDSCAERTTTQRTRCSPLPLWQGHRIWLSSRPSKPGYAGLAPSRNPVTTGLSTIRTAAGYWVPALATRAKPGSLRPE